MTIKEALKKIQTSDILPSYFTEKYEWGAQWFEDKSDALEYKLEMKQAGFTVSITQKDFTDLARALPYKVTVIRERQQHEPSNV